MSCAPRTWLAGRWTRTKIADALKEFCVRRDEYRADPYRRLPGTPREALRIALARLRAAGNTSIGQFWATTWFGTAAEDLGDLLLAIEVP